MDTPKIEMVIRELIKGKELASKLQIMLQNQFSDGGSDSSSSSIDEIVVKILRSFTKPLSVLSSCDSGEVCQIPAMTHVGSPSSGDRRSEYSGGSSKTPALKDRRGCYKRRRTTKSWTTTSPTTEDGHAWRKYGQKEILNTKFPRCYYRCTHKHDQDCKAVKQVQRMEEDSNLFKTTYFGQHTCKDLLMCPQIISNTHPMDSNLLSFGSKNQNCDQDHEQPSLPKQEPKEETQSELTSLDSIVWPDLMSQEDVISSKPHGFEMDFLSSIDFDHNDFHFGEISELF